MLIQESSSTLEHDLQVVFGKCSPQFSLPSFVKQKYIFTRFFISLHVDSVRKVRKQVKNTHKRRAVLCYKNHIVSKLYK